MHSYIIAILRILVVPRVDWWQVQLLRYEQVICLKVYRALFGQAEGTVWCLINSFDDFAIPIYCFTPGTYTQWITQLQKQFIASLLSRSLTNSRLWKLKQSSYLYTFKNLKQILHLSILRTYSRAVSWVKHPDASKIQSAPVHKSWFPHYLWLTEF